MKYRVFSYSKLTGIMLFSASIGNSFAAMQIMPPAPMSFPLFSSKEKVLMTFLSGDAAY